MHSLMHKTELGDAIRLGVYRSRLGDRYEITAYHSADDTCTVVSLGNGARRRLPRPLVQGWLRSEESERKRLARYDAAVVCVLVVLALTLGWIWS